MKKKLLILSTLTLVGTGSFSATESLVVKAKDNTNNENAAQQTVKNASASLTPNGKNAKVTLFAKNLSLKNIKVNAIVDGHKLPTISKSTVEANSSADFDIELNNEQTTAPGKKTLPRTSVVKEEIVLENNINGHNVKVVISYEVELPSTTDKDKINVTIIDHKDGQSGKPTTPTTPDKKEDKNKDNSATTPVVPAKDADKNKDKDNSATTPIVPAKDADKNKDKDNSATTPVVPAKDADKNTEPIVDNTDYKAIAAKLASGSATPEEYSKFKAAKKQYKKDKAVWLAANTGKDIKTWSGYKEYFEDKQTATNNDTKPNNTDEIIDKDITNDNKDKKKDEVNVTIIDHKDGQDSTKKEEAPKTEENNKPTEKTSQPDLVIPHPEDGKIGDKPEGAN